jgi:hypothetical protein
MAIHPATGESFRIKVQADLKPTLPTVRADIAVEYGPVMTGGKKYLCPVNAVSISRARTTRVMQQWQASFTTWGPFVTKLNDISFGELSPQTTNRGHESEYFPQILPSEISQACEVPSTHAVMQLLSFMQILSFLGSFCQLCRSGILCAGANPSKQTEPALFLACTRSLPICTSILRQRCGFVAHEG